VNAIARSVSRLHGLARSDAARGVVLALGVKACGSILAFVMLILVARAMGAQDFGVFSVWLNILSVIAVVAGCGQEALILRLWNEYVGSRRYGLARGALKRATLVSSAAAAAAAAVVGLAGLVLRQDLAWLAGACAFLCLQALFPFTTHVARAIAGIRHGDGHVEITSRLIVIAGVLLAILTGASIDGADFFALAAFGIGVGIVLQALAIRAALPDPVRRAAAQTETAEWNARAFKLWLGGVLEAAHQYVEVILIGLVLSPTAAGVYFVALRIANVFAMLADGMYIFASREIARLHFSGDGPSLTRSLRFVSLVTAALVAVGALAVIGLGQHLLAIFGQDFIQGGTALVILSLGAATLALGGPAAAVLRLTGHEGIYSTIVAVSVAGRCLAVLGLAPLFGLIGAAAASAGCSVATALALNIACRRLAGVDPSVTILLPQSLQMRRVLP
jgi:O-antigen/teichoic acid export membrane protein